MGDDIMPAVVLLSGGLDSATVLAVARRAGHACHALTFEYGQRHTVELGSATRVAATGGAVRHRIIELCPSVFAGSALTDPRVPVPAGRLERGGIPATYVPARNTIMLSYALAYAETIGAADIYIGVNATDYSGYPDCRPEYIAAFEAMANLATKAAVNGRRLRIHTPLIGLTKAETIALGRNLGVDYALTHSCYDPTDDRPCGRCDSCLLRARGFTQAGVPDPAVA